MEETQNIETLNFTIDPNEPVTQIESFCPNCEGQGITRLLLCSIPFFKDIVVSSFTCETCGYRNNDVQNASTLAEKGCRIFLAVSNKQTLNREVVKSEYATITIPEIQLEIPASTQKGSLNTIEGILKKSRDDLSALQEERRQVDPELATKLDAFLENLNNLIHGRIPFTLILDDPSGNSFISFDASRYNIAENDPALRIEHYTRTKEQMVSMGYMADDVDVLTDKLDNTNLEDKISAQNHDFAKPLDESKITEEPVEMPTECYACHQPGTVKMCVTNIPHFKETVVMAFQCDYCGAKSNEVKGGGEISPLARRIELRVQSVEDMKRDIIKSETCSLDIPELGLTLQPGTLGGLITTLEGALVKIHHELCRNVGFGMGDSDTPEDSNKMAVFLNKLKNCKHVNEPFTFILDDPLANSFISSPIENDPQIIITDYPRTEEQNEELGLADMVLDNYS
ncbi:unnamed protein product [Blepharisma stoltei]|uniref:Zinc finger ZPR1-type domain-containing protein n=1 Tax=Blepharisma stoltei TaxID=1481888 RepID=A0AAU9J6E2_9CILI|nr:unnamed protein product [Blepharisma stoltei]